MALPLPVSYYYQALYIIVTLCFFQLAVIDCVGANDTNNDENSLESERKQYLYDLGEPEEYYPIIEFNAPSNRVNPETGKVRAIHDSDKEISTPDFLYKGEGQPARVVEFYHRYCGHCVEFKPYYIDFARNITRLYGDNVRIEFHAISCNNIQHRKLCKKNQVRGFPTIFMIPAGTADINKVKIYRKMKEEKNYRSILKEYLHIPDNLLVASANNGKHKQKKQEEEQDARDHKEQPKKEKEQYKSKQEQLQVEETDQNAPWLSFSLRALWGNNAKKKQQKSGNTIKNNAKLQDGQKYRQRQEAGHHFFLDNESIMVLSSSTTVPFVNLTIFISFTTMILLLMILCRKRGINAKKE